MNNIDFLSKVSKANKHVNYVELRETFFKYPINNFINLNSLDAVLTSSEVGTIKNAKDLIFFIEAKARKLNIEAANLRENLLRKKNEELIKEAERAKEEDSKLFYSIMKAQGIVSNNPVECFGCGLVVSANGRCKC